MRKKEQFGRLGSYPKAAGGQTIIARGLPALHRRQGQFTQYYVLDRQALLDRCAHDWAPFIEFFFFS